MQASRYSQYGLISAVTKCVKILIKNNDERDERMNIG